MGLENALRDRIRHCGIGYRYKKGQILLEETAASWDGNGSSESSAPWDGIKNYGISDQPVRRRGFSVNRVQHHGIGKVHHGSSALWDGIKYYGY